MPQVRYGYDVFLSHNSADKAWVRALAGRLAKVTYNGRQLRPWLDENVLDPGLPSSKAELTSAMDLSRVLALVISPEAVASHWVQFEVSYFSANRSSDNFLALTKRPADLPEGFKPSSLAIDFQQDETFEDGLASLITALCPSPPITVVEAQSQIKVVFKAALWSDPRGISPGSTPERDGLIEALFGT